MCTNGSQRREETGFGAMRDRDNQIDENFALAKHASQSAAVNAGASRRKVRRELERGLMPDAQVPADTRRAFFEVPRRLFSCDGAGCFDSPCTINLSSGHVS